MKPITERYKGTQCEKCVQRYKTKHLSSMAKWCKFFTSGPYQMCAIICKYREDEKGVEK